MDEGAAGSGGFDRQFLLNRKIEIESWHFFIRKDFYLIWQQLVGCIRDMGKVRMGWGVLLFLPRTIWYDCNCKRISRPINIHLKVI